MPKPIVFLLSLLLLLLILAGIVASNPALILRPVLQSQLAAAGFRLQSLESVKTGTNSASASLLSADSASISLSARNIRVEYSLGQLLNGEVAGVYIESLQVSLKDSVTNRADGTVEQLDLQSLYRSITHLPLDTLTIEEARANMTSGLLSTRLDFQTSPLQLFLDGSWQGVPELEFTMDTEALDTNRVQIATRINRGDELLLEGNQEVELFDAQLVMAGSFAFNTGQLQVIAKLTERLPGDWALVNQELQLEHSMTIETADSGLLLQSLQATVSAVGAPNSNLQVLAGTDQSRLVAQFGLPVTLAVTPNTVNSGFGVQISDSTQNYSWIGDELGIHAESSLTNMRASCETWNRCSATAELQIFSPAWEFAGASGEDLRASGGLKIEQLPGLLEFSTDNASLTIDVARYGQWQIAGDLRIEEIFLILGDVDRGRIKLDTGDLLLSSDAVNLVNPGFATTINYFDEAFAGSVDISLGEQVDLDQAQLQGSINHSLVNREGHAEFNLNETQFSDSSPLSTFVEQKWLNMDIVAGTLSGAARIDWVLQDEESQVSGPITLQLDGLSGHVEDTLVVGLNSYLSGEFRDWTEIVSTPALSASIDVVDIGMPAQDVNWQYSFNTAEREMLVSELNSEMFGGKVEIADFRLQPDSFDQDLTVVLSRLDLESIVGLAGYPQLFVDGLISGYVPVSLENGKVLINDGLVAALRPGGNIRYTPGSDASAANQTMQLVNDALSNYQYETLDTRVYYDENGDLLMEVQLQGFNPDMNGGQEINLNVNVTDNIPSLLRSLKAGQEISERLEQRLQNR